MKLIFNAAGWLLFAIERLAVRGQAWLDDHYPVTAEDALDDIADYLSGAMDDARIDRYIDSHRPGMPPRGRR